MFPITMPRYAAARLRLTFSLILTASPLALSVATGQQTATPAAAAELDAITVEGQQKAKKKAQVKSSRAKPAAKAAAQPAPVAVVEAPAATSDASARDGTAAKPGLNLGVETKTGSRLGLTPLETPASVEVISGDTVRERGQTNSVDAVTQNATGFTSQASPGNGGTSLATRGFAGHGSVMQLYDGTRISVGNGTVSFPFSTWSAERIEVLRGPASVLYGEGAIGGVINVVPKKPTDFFTNEAEVAIDTNGTRRFGLGTGGPISDTVSYRFDASGHQSEGWLDNEGDFKALNLSGALSWKATFDLRFTVSHDHADQSPLRYWGTPLINGRIPNGIRDENYNVGDSKVRYQDEWTQFKTEWAPSDWFSVRNVAYRLTTDRHWRDVESYAFQTTGPNAGLIGRTDYLEIIHDQEQYGNRFDATFRAALGGGVKNELVLGFDVNRIKYGRLHNFSDNDAVTFVDPYDPSPGSFINVEGTRPEFESIIEQYALFAENRLTLSKQLSLIGGLRIDRPEIDREDLRGNNDFTKKFDDLTWRAGAVYTPVPGLAFYGQYATGVDPVGGLVSLNLNNSQFTLASGRQIEIGVKNEFWGGRGEWTLAAYDIEKEDILSPDPDAAFTTRQIGAQSSRGIEASLALRMTDAVRYEGNIALLDARYDEFFSGAGVNFAGNTPINVPEQVVTSWLTWNFLPRWEARAGVQWIGEIYNNDANTVKRPDSTVVNLGLDYDVTDKSVISLRGFNVFDEVYATGGGTTYWQLAPPRSAELSYRIKF